MEIIAERDKRIAKIILLLGGALSLLSVLMIATSSWYIIPLVMGVALFLCGFYFVVLPKNAITKTGENITIHYAFQQKNIKISDIEYISYNELGTFSTRRTFWCSLYILNNDIRNLTITVKEIGRLKHYFIISVLNTSAVAIVINQLLEKEKRHYGFP